MGIKLKVCGMKYLDNIQSVLEAGVDYMGFIFYEKSKRYMGDTLKPLVLADFPKQTKKVGVFVNASKDEVLQEADKYGLQLIQLHGDESSEYCASLSDEGLDLIKAFHIDGSFDFKLTNSYKAYCRYFLFDTKSPEYGGTGKLFDWSLLKQYDNSLPLFLSGGIDENNIEGLKQLVGLNIHAVDINSRFETEPGRKDTERINILKERLKELSDEVFGR